MISARIQRPVGKDQVGVERLEALPEVETCGLVAVGGAVDLTREDGRGAEHLARGEALLFATTGCHLRRDTGDARLALREVEKRDAVALVGETLGRAAHACLGIVWVGADDDDAAR